jgi:hypothetical protein
MTFEDWMMTKDCNYYPTDDTMAIRKLRECWDAAQKYGEAEQQLAEREKQVVMLRGIVKRTQQACLFADDDGGIGVASDVYISTELFNDICKGLAATADLAGLVVCDAVPVAWHYEGSGIELPSVVLSDDLDDEQKQNCTELFARRKEK